MTVPSQHDIRRMHTVLRGLCDLLADAVGTIEDLDRQADADAEWWTLNAEG